jgi:hypothetical protein
MKDLERGATYAISPGNGIGCPIRIPLNAFFHWEHFRLKGKPGMPDGGPAAFGQTLELEFVASVC